MRFKGAIFLSFWRPGRKERLTRAQRCILLCPERQKDKNMAPLNRILLAEDSERDIELTLAALDEYHLANEVVVVRDGAEALDYLHQRGNHSSHPNGLPVVVLLDLKMPKVGGPEVLRQMRDVPRLKPVPVVMVPSSREEQDLVRSYELGVNGY